MVSFHLRTSIIVNEDLELGGAESMAVELANTLTEKQTVTVCFASGPGSLRMRLNDKVTYFDNVNLTKNQGDRELP